MSTTYTDRQTGISTNAAIKVPCVAATTANITLEGLQTIDGVGLSSGNRVLVKNQTDAKENGIYVVSQTGWQRSSDFDGALDIVRGTQVYVISGTTNGDTTFRVSSDANTIGTSNITFSADTSSGSGVSDHGALTGLGDDDHTQYLNETRGDARYYTKSQANTLFANSFGTTGATVDGQAYALEYDGASGDYDLVTLSGGSTTSLNSLTDVTITSASDGDLLKYDSVAGGWINDTVTGSFSWSTPVNADVVPDGDGTRDLGSSANKFGEIYFDKFISGTSGGSADYRYASAETELLVTDYIDYQVGPIYSFDIGQYETSISGAGNLFAHAVAIRNNGTNTPTVAVGGHAYSSTTNTWGGNFTAGVEAGASGITAVGTELNVQMLSSNASTSAFGLVIASAGNNATRGSAIQAQANTNAAQWSFGLRFTNGRADMAANNSAFSQAFIASDSYTTSYGPTYGIHFQSVGFGTTGIFLDGCTGQYGIRVNGVHGGAGIESEQYSASAPAFSALGTCANGFLESGNATNSFNAAGQGTSAFIVTTDNYQYGLNLKGRNFSEGYEIYSDGIEVWNTGAVNFPLVGTTGATSESFGGRSLAGFVQLGCGSAGFKWIPYFN